MLYQDKAERIIQPFYNVKLQELFVFWNLGSGTLVSLQYQLYPWRRLLIRTEVVFSAKYLEFDPLQLGD